MAYHTLIYREVQSANKSLQKLWSFFLAYLGYAEVEPIMQQQQQGGYDYDDDGLASSTAGPSPRPAPRQQREGGNGGGSRLPRAAGGGGGRQTSILDLVARQGFMDWMTANTRANTNSQSGLVSAVNCCLRGLLVRRYID